MSSTEASNPDLAVLKALSSAFTCAVARSDCQFIKFKKATVSSILLQDMDNRLGNMHTHITQKNAASYGTSLARICSYLAQNGAGRL